MKLTETDLTIIATWFADRTLALDEEIPDRLAKYLELLKAWSKRINLISKGDLPYVIERHFLDSLTPIDLIPYAGALLDVGSGAGFPGIPISLLRPSLKCVLLESIHKKVLFLKAVKRELALSNVEIREGRLEELDQDPEFDVITVRALPNWERQMECIKSLSKSGGMIIYYESRGRCRVVKT